MKKPTPRDLLLQLTDSSNWDAEMSGDHFNGYRDAMEQLHEMLLDLWDEMSTEERLRARLDKYQGCDTMINDELKDVRAKAARNGEALNLAVDMVMRCEPQDSRAVSGEAVALASVVCGTDNDECWEIIRAANKAASALSPAP